MVTHSCTWGCYRFRKNCAPRIISFTINWTSANVDIFYIVSAFDCRSFWDRNKFYGVKLTTNLMIGHRPSSWVCCGLESHQRLHFCFLFSDSCNFKLLSMWLSVKRYYSVQCDTCTGRGTSFSSRSKFLAHGLPKTARFI